MDHRIEGKALLESWIIMKLHNPSDISAAIWVWAQFSFGETNLLCIGAFENWISLFSSLCSRTRQLSLAVWCGTQLVINSNQFKNILILGPQHCCLVFLLVCGVTLSRNLISYHVVYTWNTLSVETASRLRECTALLCYYVPAGLWALVGVNLINIDLTQIACAVSYQINVFTSLCKQTSCITSFEGWSHTELLSQPQVQIRFGSGPKYYGPKMFRLHWNLNAINIREEHRCTELGWRIKSWMDS